MGDILISPAAAAAAAVPRTLICPRPAEAVSQSVSQSADVDHGEEERSSPTVFHLRSTR